MNIFMINNILFLLILLVIVMTIFLTFTTYKYFKDYKTKLMNNNVVYDLPEEYKESQEEYIMPKRINVVFISFVVLILSAICFFTFIKIKSYYDNKPKVLPNGTVVYDFSTQRQPKASKILYEYIKEEEAPIDDEMKIINDDGSVTVIKMKSVLNRISAFEYDLNDDGENEIIGFTSNSAYWGTAGFSLFILQKYKNNNYFDITYILNFEPALKFYILPNKTNGFKDIMLYGSTAYNFKPMLIKNDGKVYYNQKQTEMLIKYMKDFADYDVFEITGEVEY